MIIPNVNKEEMICCGALKRNKVGISKYSEIL
jgi:hypothetical protein